MTTRKRIISVPNFPIIYRPENYGTSGVDADINMPQSGYNQDGCFIPLGCASFTRLAIGTARWLVSGYGPNTEISADPDNITYGFAHMAVGAGVWNNLAASSYNGLQRIYLPKYLNNDRSGGFIEFYYLRKAFLASFFPDKSFILNVDLGNDTITLDDYEGPYINNEPIEFYTFTGSLPEPLVEETVYYVKDYDGIDTLKVSATPGGAAIDLTSVGSGDFSLIRKVGTNYYVIFAQNGSVYVMDNPPTLDPPFSAGNLVVRWDGEPGGATGEPLISDTNRIIY